MCVCTCVCLLAFISTVVGFSSTSYTVTEGVHFASLTITRLGGNINAEVNNVTFMAIPGTADGKGPLNNWHAGYIVWQLKYLSGHSNQPLLSLPNCFSPIFCCMMYIY